MFWEEGYFFIDKLYAMILKFKIMRKECKKTTVRHRLYYNVNVLDANFLKLSLKRFPMEIITYFEGWWKKYIT